MNQHVFYSDQLNKLVIVRLFSLPIAKRVFESWGFHYIGEF